MTLFPCHSVYLEFALHMLWVYALFICSLKSHAWKRKERNPFTWCCSLTWEELWWLQDAEIIFIHSDAIFHYHSIRSLYPIAINNSTDMFLIYSTATCTAFWILEENGIINKPISYTFLQSCSLWRLKEHTEAMNGGMVIRLRVYEWLGLNVFFLALKKVQKHWPDD